MTKPIIAGLAAVLLAGTTLTAADAQKGSVSVYTAHAPEIDNEIVPMFEEATGISVSLVQAGSGDMMGNFIVTGSSGRVPRGVADGEFAVGLTLEEAAQRYVAGGAAVTIVYPEPATSALPDAVALVKDSPNPEAGKAFVDFVLSEEIQAFLVEAMQRRSVCTDVAQPEGLPGLDKLSIQKYKVAWAGAEREAIIKQYLSILRQ